MSSPTSSGNRACGDVLCGRFRTDKEKSLLAQILSLKEKGESVDGKLEQLECDFEEVVKDRDAWHDLYGKSQDEVDPLRDRIDDLEEERDRLQKEDKKAGVDLGAEEELQTACDECHRVFNVLEEGKVFQNPSELLQKAMDTRAQIDMLKTGIDKKEKVLVAVKNEDRNRKKKQSALETKNKALENRLEKLEKDIKLRTSLALPRPPFLPPRPPRPRPRPPPPPPSSMGQVVNSSPSAEPPTRTGDKRRRATSVPPETNFKRLKIS